jgi:transcriptional regulator with XRE-family HTH domain
MSKQSPLLLPKAKRILKVVGDNIKLARLRRNFSAEMVAERAGKSRTTLHSVEKGMETVSMGSYLAVLMVLGLENDLHYIAKDDLLGRKLQDAQLPNRERAPKKKHG